MKKLLMLNSKECGSMDTTNGKIYNVINDVLTDVSIEDGESIEYNQEAWLKNNEYERWITIEDNSNRDDFQVYWRDDRFMIFENNKELARYLIEFNDDVADCVANMYISFNSNK